MNNAITFHGYKDGMGIFAINPNEFVGEKRSQGLVVMCEFSYRTPDQMSCHKPYRSLEEVQEKLGNRLKLEWVSCCEPLHRGTMCYYAWEYGNGDFILAFPASGEECRFEIYSFDHGRITLQYFREL